MIIQVGFNFAPSGWNVCDGSTLSISQATALFSLLGTNFGGNGVSTFQLPDLRGRVAIGAGQGPGLSLRNLGQQGGAENVTLLTPNLPAHTHTASTPVLNAASTKATLQLAAPGSVLGHSVDGAANPMALPEIYCPAGTSATIGLGGLGPITIGSTGNNIPVATVPPFLGILNVIALQGIFPSRG
jgi:microcystin-dependent protein